MEIPTKTADDAHRRYIVGMMGSLACKPTREYLVALRVRLFELIERIDEMLLRF